jgi:hypothetical protein
LSQSTSKAPDSGVPDDDGLETVEPDNRNFYGWGTSGGQVLDVEVLAYSNDGGAALGGHQVPELTGRLLAPSTSFRKKGTEMVNLDAGSEITVTAAQVRLANRLTKADPKPGDRIKITYLGVQRLPNGNTVKDFKVQRGTITFADLDREEDE